MCPEGYKSFVILNFLTVNTAWNRRKVVEFMERYEVDTVFLDLPSSFEPYLAQRLLPPADVSSIQDLRACEPIIHFCWDKNIKIYCYLDDKISEGHANINVELAKLVLKFKISGKIDILEWKKLLFDDINLRLVSSEYSAMKIRENARGLAACLNLTPEAEKYLKEEGFQVERIKLYDFNRPVDRLYQLAFRELNGEKVTNEEYFELIRKHISFIDTVVEVGYEDACKFLWF
ncbi:MAG: hypothetical protein QXT98_06920 [Archaeoglobaceae archaeon]